MMFRFDMNLFDFSNIFKGENANKVKENEEKKEKGPTKSPKKEEEVLKVSSKEFKKKVTKTRTRAEDTEWTEGDTGELMDIMETALTRVRRRIAAKLGRLGRGGGQASLGESEGGLESLVTSAHTSTLGVVEEINNVMKIMAEVTVEMCDDGDNTDDEIEEGHKVGQLLEEEGDTSTKEKWQGLVRKLSVKRQKSRRKRRQKDGVTDQQEQGQDDVPEDWQPDFIPRKGQSGNSRDAAKCSSGLTSSQPDVVTESLSSLTSLERSEDSGDEDLDRASLEDFSEDEDIKLVIRYRSSKRRYLQKQMGDMRRHSLVSEIFNEEEED